MRYVAFLLVACATLFLFAPEGASQVKLNEILADPNSDWDGDGQVTSKEDEWVEVMNIGSSTVDLSAYRITDESAGTDFRFALSGMLAPGEVKVFFGSDVVAWQTANGVSAFGFSLNNGGDTVYLYQVGGSTSVEDSYTYASVSVVDDRAVGRLPIGTGEWYVFDGLNAYTGTNPPLGTGCMPSPGTSASCATPVETSSWGAVKSSYAD